VWIELAREKHAGGLQDLVCSTQLGDLTAKGFDLLTLLTGQDVFAPALISFCLTDVFAERLALDAEIPRDMRDGRPDSNTRRAPRSSSSCEYFLALGMLGDFSLRQGKPGIEVV
jgi:hypothetical protein